MTHVIGLTGGMGSGKSTASQYLTELGAIIVDADKIGHEVYQPNTTLWRQLIKIFGNQILASDNTIDRKKLGAIVFGNPELLKKLDSLVLPTMFQIAKKRIEEARKQGVKVVILDAPTLFESKWDPLVEEVWVVVADEANVIKRAMARTGLPEEQVRSRMSAQMSNEERIKRANTVIHNNGTVEDLRKKVKELWSKLKT
jgi:dephospho-CoA kinase